MSNHWHAHYQNQNMQSVPEITVQDLRQQQVKQSEAEKVCQQRISTGAFWYGMKPSMRGKISIGSQLIAGTPTIQAIVFQRLMLQCGRLR